MAATFSRKPWLRSPKSSLTSSRPSSGWRHFTMCASQWADRLRVRVYNSVGQPAGGVAVTFTAPTIATTGPSGSFPGGAPSVTVTSDGFGFAPPLTDNSSTLFTANPFSGPYVIQITGTVDGFPILAVINMTNLGQGEGCEAINSTIQFVSSNQIIVTPVSITSRGTYSVVVANPSPGGATRTKSSSSSRPESSAGIPIIRADNPLSPSKPPAGSGRIQPYDLWLRISRSDAWVNFGTVRLNRSPEAITSITVTRASLAGFVSWDGADLCHQSWNLRKHREGLRAGSSSRSSRPLLPPNVSTLFVQTSHSKRVFRSSP